MKSLGNRQRTGLEGCVLLTALCGCILVGILIGAGVQIYLDSRQPLTVENPE